jgi:uncharacterized protein
VIIWDTCALIAASDADDQDHARCVELMRHTPRPLLVPYPVLTEVSYLLEREQGTRAESKVPALHQHRTGQPDPTDPDGR